MDKSYLLPETGFIRIQTILEIIAIGKSSWWDGVKKGIYPQPVRIGQRVTAWRVEDIRELVKALGLRRETMSSTPSGIFNVLDVHTDVEPKIPYLFQDILSKRGFGILRGEYKTGKSLLVGRLAYSLSMGDRFAEFTSGSYPLSSDNGTCLETGCILYVVGENKQALKSNIFSFNQYGEEWMQDSKTALVTIIPVEVQMSSMTFDDQLQELKTVTKAKREEYELRGAPVRMIVFDTLSACFACNDPNNSGERQKIANAMHRYAEEFDCFVLLITHRIIIHGTKMRKIVHLLRWMFKNMSALISSV